jgi:hypothetical protein
MRILFDFDVIKLFFDMDYKDVEERFSKILDKLHFMSANDEHKIYLNLKIEKEIYEKIKRTIYKKQMLLDICVIDKNFSSLDINSSILKQASFYNFSKKKYIVICRDLDLYQKLKEQELNCIKLSEFDFKMLE